MRSSLLPRRRPLERICDACQQQRRELSSSTSRSISLFSKPSSSPCTPSTSIPRRSKAPAAAATSLLSNSRAFTHAREMNGAEAASRKPAEPEQQQQQQPSSTNASSKQAVVPPTHYELFPETFPQGPPPHSAFAVDVPTLRREFLQLQAKAHPDMHPQSHKNRADAASARINEAFKTLTNPLLRAQYLLELAGRGG
ncbi:hypothetical protein PG996_012317 [Apiospora saccharicola]|uniref:J domain-containing protein n=1 Tax=Apiospora saccharicola TaxID=335842 RepID=A0ABR1U4A7_9PEZI